MSTSISRMPKLSTRILDIRFDADQIWFRLEDGRTLGVPLTWFPRLDAASDEERRRWELIPGGDAVHWSSVDEDLSASGLLGLPD